MISSLPVTLFSFLSLRMKELGLSPDSLASRCGIADVRRLRKALVGSNVMPLSWIAPIGSALGVEPDEFQRQVLSTYFEDLDGAGIRFLPLSGRVRERQRTAVDTKAVIQRGATNAKPHSRWVTLLRDPDVGWRTITMKWGDQLMGGKHAMPAMAHSRLEMALAYLTRDDAGLWTLMHLESCSWPLDADGRHDDAKKLAEIQRKMDQSGASSEPFGRDDRIAILLALRQHPGLG